MIAQGVDALILQARDADAIVTSIQEADAAHIPVFMVDQGANGGDFISLGGNDNYCMGYRGMETLLQLLGGKGKVMHLTGTPGTLIVTWNAAAVMQTMVAYPGATLVHQSYANWKADEALRDVEDVLTVYPDLAGIYVHSEVMTPGVVQALKAHDLVGKVLVVSGGTDPESLQELKNNEIQATVSWDSYAGAQRTLQAAYDYMTKGIVPPRWNPWVIYMNYADGRKVPIDCPVPGWDPFAGKGLPPQPTPPVQ
jgi:ABC-type sugar transport system substrate-binding protein